jgi:hypothetical protein
MAFNITHYQNFVEKNGDFLRKCNFSFECKELPDLSFLIHTIEISENKVRMTAPENVNFMVLRDLKVLKEKKHDFTINILDRTNHVVGKIKVSPLDITWSIVLAWNKPDDFVEWDIVVTKEPGWTMNQD